MTGELEIHGLRAQPATHVTVLRGLTPADPTQRRRAWEAVVRAFAAPVYAHLRVASRLERDAARRASEAFLAALHDPDFLVDYDPRRRTFRAFVLARLEAFSSEPGRARRRAGAPPVRVDFDAVESSLPPRRRGTATAADPARSFVAACDRVLREIALERFRDGERRAGRTRRLDVFERYELHDPASGPRPKYAELAEALSIRTSAVTNDLHAARAEFRSVLLAVLRELTATQAEYRAEAERVAKLPVRP